MEKLDFNSSRYDPSWAPGGVNSTVSTSGLCRCFCCSALRATFAKSRTPGSNGSFNNSGSMSAPWTSVQAVLLFVAKPSRARNPITTNDIVPGSGAEIAVRTASLGPYVRVQLKPSAKKLTPFENSPESEL